MQIRRLGSDYGGHSVVIDNLNEESIVYSAGLGDDASFDLALIEEFGCQVFAFDPTLQSIQWFFNHNGWLENFHFYPYGVAAHDESGRAFYVPRRHDRISHSVIDRGTNHINVLMYCIDSLAKMLGHPKIDLLKMDIEGAEYEVIENFPSVPIEQIAIEFHHFWDEIDVAKTIQAVHAMKELGYSVFHKSQSGYDYGFIKNAD